MIGAATGEYDASNQCERLVTTRDLVDLIGLSRPTQLNYMADPKRHHKMPPNAFKRPGSNKWLWKLGGVLAWLDSGKRVEPPFQSPSQPSQPRCRSRPKGSLNKTRRIQQIEAAKMGLAKGGRG